LRFFTSTFIAYAAIWTILEPLISIVPPVEKYFSGELKFFTLILVSSLIGFYRNSIPQEIIIKHSNSLIKVIFGDLFSFDGLKAIPVSRYFFETGVVQTSLQNKLIQMFQQSNGVSEGLDIYKKRLSDALQVEPFQEKFRNVTQQKEKYYSLGTTAILKLDDRDYMLFALTETELKGHIPKDNCDVSKMWTALEIFWEQARIHARGESVNIPLIGSGVTGIRLNPTRILELNLLAIANAIEKGGKITTEEVRVILHPKYIEDINLNDFQSIWH
jgi:Domain of unknown function (DUF6430)